MAEYIAACGVIIFEFQIDVAPKSERFPRLNRLISGLSLGALVVKAAKRSGSLITAYFAAEQSLEVFTIFHSIHNSTAKGCRALIRQGAKLVESIDDLLKETAGQIELKASPPGELAEPELDKDYQRLLELARL